MSEEGRIEAHADEPKTCATEKATSDRVGDDSATKTEFDQGDGSSRKKRKCAIFLVYLGHEYQGMQRNPGARSIEDELFQAMFKAGGISERNATGEKAFQKVHWSRAARTDKGVSAICQVVSTMLLAPEGIVERINEHLPDDIRVLGYKRTVKGFDARKACDRRRYEYIFPEWMFDPSLTPSSREEMNSMSPQEFVDRRDGSYVFDEAAVKKLNDILATFEGTHNFHNYTIRLASNSPQAKRYILSFGCNGVIDIGGERWVSMQIVGQSFLLHQIRKMVAMAVMAFRGMVPESAITYALRSKERQCAPMAPSVGLFLENCYFDSYNNQWGHMHEELDSAVYADQIQAFKRDKLYPSLAERDRSEHCNAQWIHEMYSRRVSNFHRYPGFVREDWDNPARGEAGMGDGERGENGENGKNGKNGKNGEDFESQKSGGPKRTSEAVTETVAKPKKRMIDVSGEYSD